MKKSVLCIACIAAAVALTGCVAPGTGNSNGNEPEGELPNKVVFDYDGETFEFNELIGEVSEILFSVNIVSSRRTIIEGDDVSKVLAYFDDIRCVIDDDIYSPETEDESNGWGTDVMILSVGSSLMRIFKSGVIRFSIDNMKYKSIEAINYDGFVATMHKLVELWY